MAITCKCITTRPQEGVHLPFAIPHSLTACQTMDNIKNPIKAAVSDRTVGVDFSTMTIGNGDVSVWDFGGQLEYAVTHQLLLSVEV